MLERKKWLGFYDGFDAVIFTLAISEFDQQYENETGKHVTSNLTVRLTNSNFRAD